MRRDNDELEFAWHEGWKGRWFLYLAGSLLGLALLAGGMRWPFAAAAAAVVVLAGLLVRRRPRGPAPLDGEILARRAARLTDLTVEGLVTALPVPAVLLDDRLVVRTHNAKAAALVAGLKRGDPLALSLRAPEVAETVRRTWATNAPQAVAYAERVPVARWFAVESTPVAVTPQAQGGDRPDFVLVCLRDLTEEKRLERLRADFVANASHELRTPLASVVGFIETIQGPARNDPEARERFLGIMLAQARRMSRLIDDLLSLSRIELNEHVRPLGTVDVAAVVEHVRDTLAPYALDEGVTVEIRGAEAPLTVNGEQDELIRLFENLVQNAIKYGAEGGRVEIEIARESREGRGGDAMVCVRDHGPGIPPEHLPRLTERFYRADADSSRAKSGTGLGLALAKHILNRHRGRLAIDSRPGEGATFTVRIPLAGEGTAADVPQSAQHTAPPRLSLS